MEGVAEPLLSQASSHSPLDPISGATLFEQEKKRRDELKARGNCLTGCRELDHEVLLGGFERGCVVGISAEEEEVGLLVSCTGPLTVRICCVFQPVLTWPGRSASRPSQTSSWQA